jgi:urease accessory protein
VVRESAAVPVSDARRAVGLQLLADGRLPTGGHAHSSGVEAAVEIGDVRDAATLDCYLRARLATTGLVDAAFAAAACAAVTARDRDRLVLLDLEYAARTPSAYLREVSRRLGRQLLRTAQQVWPGEPLSLLADELPAAHHPIVLGGAVAAVGGSPGDATALAVHHLAGSVTGAAVRLLGLDPVEVVAAQAAATADAVARAEVTFDPYDQPCRLPATGGTLTEILGEHHGARVARLFVA